MSEKRPSVVLIRECADRNTRNKGAWKLRSTLRWNRSYQLAALKKLSREQRLCLIGGSSLSEILHTDSRAVCCSLSPRPHQRTHRGIRPGTGIPYGMSRLDGFSPSDPAILHRDRRWRTYRACSPPNFSGAPRRRGQWRFSGRPTWVRQRRALRDLF